MIVDSSALIAILLQEADAPAILDLIARAPSLKMSAGTWLEANIVASNLEPVDTHHVGLQRLLAALPIEIVAVDAEQARAAFAAHLAYGRKRHPAKLNLGDCFSYALSKCQNEPLLFKGNDFSQTDIVPALA